MSKFETVCPYCKKTNVVEKSNLLMNTAYRKFSALTARRGGQRI